MIYPFECVECSKQEDREMSVAEYTKTKDQQVCSCGGKMIRVWTPIGLTEYKCGGFFDTDEKGKRSR